MERIYFSRGDFFRNGLVTYFLPHPKKFHYSFITYKRQDNNANILDLLINHSYFQTL